MDESQLNEAEKIIASVTFPSQPDILIEIQQEMNQTEPRFKKISEFIMKDVGLTAKIIKLVNSPFYGLRNEVKSVERALGLLGLNNFYNIVLSSSLRDAFTSKNMTSKQFDFFFDHSLMVAQISQIIAKNSLYHFDDLASSNVVYMAGLFHDCGIPLLVQKFPDYFNIINEGLQSNIPIAKIEESEFNTNHCVIGCLVANSWKLPSIIRQAIFYHHEEDFTFHDDVELKRTLAALMLAENIIVEHTGNEINFYDYKFSSEEISTNILEELDLTEDKVTEIEDIAADEVLNL